MDAEYESHNPPNSTGTDLQPELTILSSTTIRSGACFACNGASLFGGFDIVAGGQLAALPAFQKQFGVLQPSGDYVIPALYLSAWSSIAPACEIAATFFVVPSLEKYGRKPGILVANIISVAGVLLQQLATDWRTHLAGRGVNGGRKLFSSLP
ncbi:hypothetical protein AnigIFM56816_005728 [Aspergillus niger]|uniref:Contig An06c0090, genomic contig n=2 Tax=Aspergillus niger TaxID=5061 RepID=A2QLT8_ASPNC|nr:uncharacterized protein An06g02390 [Aspergillus niger]CAK48083.1 unnamed protein product [Aspergillus niger]GJP96967.1 unnamed protein product [Aspergillus niger]GKZ56597.1 hypothetical protein AnigIFM49718_001864 [Aspergillus niger]GKZ64094.1 hypothetical protein AnigIFM50267_003553 [Aspergillus niger]GKZ81216.1 hypothetical protein AnigIFM56816_005728 [Aspergillus niger]